MTSSFLLVSRQVFILFALMAVGFVCNRRRIVDEAAVKGMVNILLLAVTPCLIIHAFQRPFEAQYFFGLGWAFLAAVLVHGLGILLSLLMRPGVPEQKSVLRYAVIFSNAGFMGLPLEQALLGDLGVFYGAVYVAVFNLLCWSYGLVVMCGSLQDLRLRTLFLNPGTIGIALGLPFFLLSVKLPAVIGEPVKLMADINTPLAMIIIGWYLARADFKSVFRLPLAFLAIVLRLLVIPCVVVGGFYALKILCPALDRTMALAMITAASAPTAALTTMFAARYNRDVALSVGVVALTTLACALTMPLILGLAWWLF